MLKKTNILGIVTEKDLGKKLIIWDGHQNKTICELRFNHPILNLRLRADKIIAACEENKLYVFNINTLENINLFDTFENDKGIFGVSSDDNKLVIAFPFRYRGYVKIKDYSSPINLPTLNAHDNKIACLTINHEGTLLATASEKGTLIRIFKTANGEMTQELRRGTKIANVFSISFDFNSKFIGCSSNTGTSHIFCLTNSLKFLKQGKNVKKVGLDNNLNRNVIEQPKNQKSFLGKITSILKIKIAYLESEWSFAQFRVPEHESIINFGQDHSVVLLTNKGKLYQASFDPRSGGECVKIAEKEIYAKNKNNQNNFH